MLRRAPLASPQPFELGLVKASLANLPDCRLMRAISTMNSELRDYRNMVTDAMRQAFDSGKPRVFENEGPDHARVVLEVMLANSSQQLDIVAGQMDADVWPVNELIAFLERNEEAQIRLVLDDLPEGKLPAKCAAKDLARYSDRIFVRHFAHNLNLHLCVADRKHVRLEYDRSSKEASITFGDPKVAGLKADEVFQKVWALSKKVHWPERQFA
jgi:hypothetical protein